MIGSLAARNLRHQRRLLLVLLVGMVAFQVFTILVTASFDGGGDLSQLLDVLPSFLRSFIDAQLPSMAFPVLVAFSFQHPFVLVGCCAFVMLGASIPAADRDEGTLELFLAHPLRRHQYLLACMVPSLLGAVLLPLALLVGMAIGLGSVEVEQEAHWSDYLDTAAALSALLLSVSGMTLLLSTGGSRRGTAVARVVGVLLPLLVLEAFATLWSPLAQVRWLSPFHHSKPLLPDLVPSSTGNPWVLVGLFVVTVGLATWRFERLDI